MIYNGVGSTIELTKLHRGLDRRVDLDYTEIVIITVQKLNQLEIDFDDVTKLGGISFTVQWTVERNMTWLKLFLFCFKIVTP
jgi:hypothetical protein